MDQILYAHSMVFKHTSNPSRRTHTHPYIELTCCLEGAGNQLTPFGEEAFREGDIFFYLPGEAHLSYCRPGESVRLAALYFDEDSFSASLRERGWFTALVRHWERSPIRRLSLAEARPGKVGGNIRAILDEFDRSDDTCLQAAQSRLTLLLLDIYRDVENKVHESRQPSPMEKIRQLILYMNVHYEQNIDVPFAMDFCCISRSHFHHLFRQHTGMGLSEYRNRLKVAKAREYLVERQNESILSIAQSCGYNEISHFCHQFKRYSGYSPREWRNRHPGGSEGQH